MRSGTRHQDWRFEQEVDQNQLEELGLVAILQALRARLWVHRRIESVEFESADTALRTVRLDLTVPTPPPELSKSLGDVPLIPIGFLQKQRKFRPLICQSGDRHDLPVLTQRARTAVASKGLVAYARGAFANHKVEQAKLDEFLGGLESIVTDNIAMGVAAVRPFLPGSGESAETADAETPELLETTDQFTQVLRADPLFPTIAWNLATHFMLLVPLPVEAGERYSVTYSHAEKIVPEPVSWVDRAFRFAGFYAHRFQFPALSSADASSFHFLFKAPPGLQVTRGEFRLSRKPLSAYSMRRGLLDSVAEKQEDHDVSGWGGRFALELADEEAGSMASAHLFSSDLPADSLGSMWFNLRPLGTALLPPAWLTTVIVAAITTAVAISTNAFENHDSSMALLLVGPSALALYIVRPLENRLTTRVLFGARTIVTAAGLVSFATAVLLALGSQGWLARILWNTLPGLVWAGVGVLTVAWLITWQWFRDRVAHMSFMRDERAKQKYAQIQAQN
jgi:hypothetical protein